MTDHLGNVLAVIGEVRKVRTYDTILGYPPESNNPIIVTGYKPRPLALYDYYPFGMMMEQRTYDDSAAPACVAAELDEPIHWWLFENSKDVGGSCYPCGFDTLGTTHLSPTAMAISAIDTYRLTIAPTPIPDYLLYGNWMTTYRLSGLKPGIVHRVRLEVSGINKPDSSRFPVRVYNQTFSTELTLLDTFFLPNVAPATFTMTFTPTTPSDTTAYMAIGWQRIYDTVNMPYHYSFTIDSIELHYDTTVILPVMARVCIGDNYRYGFNGKYKDDEWAGRGNHYDYGARLYDPRVARWKSIDPLVKKFPDMSPYDYAWDNPIWFVDRDGKQVYILVYTNGEQTFKTAALTRRKEITSMQSFNPLKDHVYVVGISSWDELQPHVDGITANAQEIGYGKTVEFSVWSHGAEEEGPVGDRPNQASRSELGARDHQMTIEDWAYIDYNFDPDNSMAAFYGCNTAEFAAKFLDNVSTVKMTAGQPESAYPSSNRMVRKYPGFFNKSRPPLYYVAAKGSLGPGVLFGKTQPAIPMDVFLRGDDKESYPNVGPGQDNYVNSSNNGTINYE